MKYEKTAMTNRDQEGKIKILTNDNLKIAAELETRVAQLNKFTGDIARQNQRVGTLAIRDDEYFAREFADLATDIRGWSFAHFFTHSRTFVPKAVDGYLQDAIRQIAVGTSLPEIFTSRATTRRVIAGLLADQLRRELFDPLLLGLLPKEFLVFESFVEKTGIQKSAWLSQTISLFIKREEFEGVLDYKVRILSESLHKMLGGLVAQESDGSKVSKRGQKLQTIVQRAANLAIEVSQQSHWFRFYTPSPGAQFNPQCMEDVGGEVLLEGDDPEAFEDNRRVSLSVFPCVYRQDRIEGENKPQPITINWAWVTIEKEDSRAVVEQEKGDEKGNITNEEANRGAECAECAEESPSGEGGDAGELATRGGSENSPHSGTSAAEVVSPVSASREAHEGVN
ncbi:unnamed protein product [Tuber aestivum]|uniref:Uncharacterized protein n=1 Tax=Tuber aestivum TaxID=59557 RepID=A0A292Q0D7_9PEZI|nr:unnamed protein product [Tuber aestivum]